MRRVKVRVHKRRVISPPDLPEDFEGELVLPDEATDEADRRRELLGETNRAYAMLKADPEAWKEERKERALWEGTLADGFESHDKDS